MEFQQRVARCVTTATYLQYGYQSSETGFSMPLPVLLSLLQQSKPQCLSYNHADFLATMVRWYCGSAHLKAFGTLNKTGIQLEWQSGWHTRGSMAAPDRTMVVDAVKVTPVTATSCRDRAFTLASWLATIPTSRDSTKSPEHMPPGD